ncbi:hypothetical protein Tco_1200956 [Tanacetum coccineum]
MSPGNVARDLSGSKSRSGFIGAVDSSAENEPRAENEPSRQLKLRGNAADSDDEDLVNLDIDDGVNVMSADVARGHGGDGGGDDRPPPYQIPTGCRGCLGNRGKGTRKPNLGGKRAGGLHTRQET